jgi:hypothetical protein
MGHDDHTAKGDRRPHDAAVTRRSGWRSCCTASPSVGGLGKSTVSPGDGFQRRRPHRGFFAAIVPPYPCHDRSAIAKPESRMSRVAAGAGAGTRRTGRIPARGGPRDAWSPIGDFDHAFRSASWRDETSTRLSGGATLRAVDEHVLRTLAPAAWRRPGTTQRLP